MPEVYYQQPPDILVWNVNPNVWGTAASIVAAMLVVFAILIFSK